MAWILDQLPCVQGSRTESVQRSAQRTPERTILHVVARENLETVLAEARRAGEGGAGLPVFVEKELRAYLGCGLLKNGFLRVRCERCGGGFLVAFSCKTRAACPSCATRRMQDGAEHLLDRLLPVLPYRQWVTSYPKWLRIHLALDAALMSRVLTLSLREIFRWQRARARRQGHSDTRTAAVSFLQRFGSALQLNPHAHTVIPDGVFAARFSNPRGEPPRFLPLGPPDDDAVNQVLERIVRRVVTLAESLGLRDRPLSDEQHALAESVALPLPAPATEVESPARRSAFLRGFSLHANVSCHAHDREALGRLCRYALRPPVALERISRSASGEIVYRMKRPLPNGATHLKLPAKAFVRRVASLIPPPRRHLVRYFGMFAAHARDRAALVACAAPARSEIAVGQMDATATRPLRSPPVHSLRPRRLPWAELLRRVFAVDVTVCASCGGAARIIAAIVDREVANAVLTAMGIEAPAPRTLPARAPPLQSCLSGVFFDPCVDPPASRD